MRFVREIAIASSDAPKLSALKDKIFGSFKRLKVKADVDCIWLAILQLKHVLLNKIVRSILFGSTLI